MVKAFKNVPESGKLGLSIIIVTWNAKKYVWECLKSLEQQSKDLSVEIIVVDNASSDGTPELVRGQFPQTRLVQNQRNLGFARANNIGINLSRGKYVCLVNSDVYVPSGCLAMMLSYLEQNPTVGILGPRMLRPDGAVGRSYMRFPTVWNCFCRALALDSLFKGAKLFGGFLMTDFKNNRTADVEVLNGWFWMVRRSALEAVGLLDEDFFMYGEDIDWCKRFHNAGWRTVYYPEAEAIHYGGASSSSAPVRFYIEMEHANLYYWKKHHHRFGEVSFFVTTWLHNVIRLLGYAVLYLLKRSQRSEAVFKIRRSIACILWLIGLKPSYADERE